MNQTRTIRLPVHVIKEINAYLRAARQLAQVLDREPSTEEIAELLEKSCGEVKRLLGLSEHVASVDKPITGDGARLVLDTIPDDDDTEPLRMLQNDDMRAVIERWLACLGEKQRAVVEWRFGLSGRERATLERTGRALGLTRERVRQIQLHALERLRQLLDEEGLSQDTLFG
jgi:RNA polymerase nonessential primary-like sigma factor